MQYLLESVTILGMAGVLGHYTGFLTEALFPVTTGIVVISFIWAAVTCAPRWGGEQVIPVLFFIVGVAAGGYFSWPPAKELKFIAEIICTGMCATGVCLTFITPR